MKLTNYQCKNVDTTASHLCGALIHLKVVQKVPEDIMEQPIEVFQMTSISDFNDIFKVLKINMKLDASAEKPDPEEIIKIAETNYREMKEGGLWTGVNNQGSTFKARNDRPCWNCGEEGHISCECPKPKDKGKHGCGKGRNGNQKKQFNHRHPLRIWPKEGETQKTIDGIIHCWCSKCKMWHTNHDTKSHVKGLRKNQEQQGANVAETALCVHMCVNMENLVHRQTNKRSRDCTRAMTINHECHES